MLAVLELGWGRVGRRKTVTRDDSRAASEIREQAFPAGEASSKALIVRVSGGFSTETPAEEGIPTLHREDQAQGSCGSPQKELQFLEGEPGPLWIKE